MASDVIHDVIRHGLTPPPRRARAPCGRPAHNLVNGPACTDKNQRPAGQNCTYEDALFESHVTRVIRQHDGQTPLFLFWAPHAAHTPLQVPPAYKQRFSFIADPGRKTYAAMTAYMDDVVGLLLAALQARPAERRSSRPNR